MKKKEFQNLPSTETPINAENLNEMQDNIEESCVIVSPTEPTTNEKVWIQKGKNLFNMLDSSRFTFREKSNQYQTFYLSSYSSNEIKVYAGGGNYTEAYIDVKGLAPNTQYSICSEVKENTTGYDAYMEISSKSSNNGELTINILLTNGNNAVSTDKYIVFTNIQLEQGSTATEYEEYVNRKINVDGLEFLDVEKTNNLQNYSTSEQVIGTWIDGKPLYRKTIQKSFVDDWTTLHLNDINADTIYINYGKTFANFKIDNTYYSNGQFYISETDFFRTFIANKNELLVAFASEMTEREATITIEYTKTTD